MRTSIEGLAWQLWKDDEIREQDMTLKQVAEKYGEPVERIMDALDVIKIVQGQSSQIPALDWRG